jgi:hypothetical protein
VLVEVSPQTATAVPGQPVVLAVRITNTEEIISAYEVKVLGVDERWVTLSEPKLSLFPDTSGALIVTITLPEGIPSGTRKIGIEVRQLTAPTSTVLKDVELRVPEERGVQIALEPVTVNGGKRASVGVLLHNTGNTPMPIKLAATDEEEKIDFEFEPAEYEIEPGERRTVTAKLRARRRFAGSPKIRPYTIRYDGPDAGVETFGTFVQRPLLTRGMLSLLGLLLAATVFAAVIAGTLSHVVNQSVSDRNLLTQLVNANENAANGANGGGGADVSGSVTLLTKSQGSNTGVVATVSVYSANNTSVVVASTASQSNGSYNIPGLAPGSYKFRYAAAGFVEIWYPDSLTADNATPVNVHLGQNPNIDVRLGGLPATIEGTVVGDDVAGATVTLQVPPANADATDAAAVGVSSVSGDVVPTGSVVTTTAVDATGTFTLAQVPSPATYEVLVTKQGYAPAVQKVDLDGGEDRKGVLLRLVPGDGEIDGKITSTAGPVKGATITATDGTTTLSAISLTQDDPGAFALRSLATPSSYTLTVTAGGFADETVTLSLTKAQHLTGVNITMQPGAGSISGTVTATVPGNTGPAGGVTVTVSNGTLSLKTVTLSSGAVGSFHIGGVPLPGSYTVTFTRPDLATEALTVAVSAQQLDVPASVVMHSATGIVEGVVRDTKNALLGNVIVTLTEGSTTYSVETSTVPSVGLYEIDNVPPGSYTLSFSRFGSNLVSRIVLVSAGVTSSQDGVLPLPTVLQGTITANGHTLAGAVIRVYLSSDYPGTLVKTTTTGSDGTYKIEGLAAPQTYIVEFLYPAGSTVQKTRQVTLEPTGPGRVVTVDETLSTG